MTEQKRSTATTPPTVELARAVGADGLARREAERLEAERVADSWDEALAEGLPSVEEAAEAAWQAAYHRELAAPLCDRLTSESRSRLRLFASAAHWTPPSERACRSTRRWPPRSSRERFLDALGYP